MNHLLVLRRGVPGRHLFSSAAGHLSAEKKNLNCTRRSLSEVSLITGSLLKS